ncbi:MAG: hypothetical protein VW802_10930 [Rhodospirillaceae bacterium]|jgi:hypothetical protein
MDSSTMEKPVPPKLSEFGLTEQDLRSAPKLLNQNLTRSLQLRIGFILGVVLGVGSLWGMFVKTDSFVYGVFFGSLIGFVVFLMVTFLSGAVVVLLANAISYIQSLYYGRFNEKTRQVYRYFNANKEFDRSMKVYERYRQSKRY